MMIRHPSTLGDRTVLPGCQPELDLDKGNHIRLRSALDMQVSPMRGLAWITVEMDPGESVVRPGEVFVISSGKTALVGSLGGHVTLRIGLTASAMERAQRPKQLSLVARLHEFFRPSYVFGIGACQ